MADLISGYGDYKLLPQDPDSKTLRDLKGQLQQVAKLEDMAAGQAPSKTGVERREPSDEERGLIKKVEEKKKEGGFEVTDPERQLRTALDAIKRRYENQIKDLQDQIDKGEKTVKTKHPSPTDAELERLKARRDELKQQFDEVFGKPELTDAQRIAAARKAIEASIARYEEMLATGKTTPEAKPSKTPVTPELTKLRQKAAALRQKVAEMRQEEAIRESIASLEKHLEAGTLPGTTPGGPLPSTEAIADLRTLRANLVKQLGKSAPAVAKRLQKSIDRMIQRFENNDFVAPVKEDLITGNKELEQLQYKQRVLERAVRNKMRSLAPRKLSYWIVQPYQLSRNIVTSIDWSALLRQGKFVMMAAPHIAIKNIPVMAMAGWSKKMQWRIETEIRNRPNAYKYLRSLLDLASYEYMGGMTVREEEQQGDWAQYIPLVAGSNRAYVTFLNAIRADYFDALIRSIEKRGESSTIEQEKIIANLVNVGTGRAPITPKLKQAVTAATAVFWAPRFVISRFQLALGQPLWRARKDKVARRIVGREMAKYLMGQAIYMWLLSQMIPDADDDEKGMDAKRGVGTSLISSDFGKHVWGRSRIDTLAGMSQVMVFMSRIFYGKSESTRTGEIKDLRGADVPWGQRDMTDIAVKFFRSKLSPGAAATWNILSGKDFMDNQTKLGNEALKLITPLVSRDVYEGFVEEAGGKAAALSLLAFLGEGIQTYIEEEKKRPPPPRPGKPSRPSRP